MATLIDVFEVLVSHERSYGPRVCVCSSQAIAEVMAQGHCGYAAGPGKIMPRKAIIEEHGNETHAYIIDGDPVVLDEGYDDKLTEVRQRALQKLSSEERHALGLPAPTSTDEGRIRSGRTDRT